MFYSVMYCVDQQLMHMVYTTFIS